MLRAASTISAMVAMIAFLAFVALYFGGYPSAIAHERMALAPLIAGLCAAVLNGYRRGNFPRLTAAVCLTLLASWVLFLLSSG